MNGYTSSDSEGGAEARGQSRRPLCRSKNALLARENRRKKKAYVDGLEATISTLKRDSKKLRTLLGTQATYINELHSEIKYLRATLANADEIGCLVRKLRGPINMTDVKKTRSQTKDLPDDLIFPIDSPTADMPLSPSDDYSFVFNDVNLSPMDDNVMENVLQPMKPVSGNNVLSIPAVYTTFYNSTIEHLKSGLFSL
ncbi:uncharacterized protein LOC143913442 [Arctopsyche grandis]|uniref:uncharacterized protein LOC143913442 n=1 Tax=Arctopsyche grandis TaxID=121162 RepID=UPI00406D7C09